MSAHAQPGTSRPVSNDRRWRGRPVLAALLRALLAILPLAAALGVAYLVSRALPPAADTGGVVMAWLVVLVASSVALVAVERLTRRLLPLPALLKLSLAFPDAAPSRFRVARRAGRVRDLQEQVERARRAGRSDAPTRAAEQILALVGALTVHDRQTRGHSERVRVFTDLIADELDLSRDDRDRLRWSALLHDVGKLHVHDHILNKPARLSDREWEVMRQHPLEGHRIIQPLAGWLGPWARTVLEHHEWYDGSGYPQGLSGDEISRGARIVSVADAYDVMTAARAYKRPVSAAEARTELAAQAGTQFDPAMVRAFLAVPLTTLRWALGPLAWLLEIPLVRNAISAAHRMGLTVADQAGTAGVAGATATAVGVTALGAGMLGGSMQHVSDPPAQQAGAAPAGDVVVPLWRAHGQDLAIAAERQAEAPQVLGTQIERPADQASPHGDRPGGADVTVVAAPTATADAPASSGGTGGGARAGGAQPPPTTPPPQAPPPVSTPVDDPPAATPPDGGGSDAGAGRTSTDPAAGPSTGGDGSGGDNAGTGDQTTTDPSGSTTDQPSPAADGGDTATDPSASTGDDATPPGQGWPGDGGTGTGQDRGEGNGKGQGPDHRPFDDPYPPLR